MRAGFLNAGTLKGHIDEFLQYLRDNPSYDIFGVAETRLGPSLKDDSFVLGGYSLVRQDRNRRGGGIAIYIKSAYKFTTLAHSNTTVQGKPLIPEYLMGTIQGKNMDPIFICLKNSDALIRDLRQHSENFWQKIIMGDFNANLLSAESDTRFLLDLASELALKVVDHGPTHFATHPGTWIDAIFVGIKDTVLTSENRPAPYDNRHNVIDVVLDISTPDLPCDSFTYREFNKITAEALNLALADCDWTQFDCAISDPDQLLHRITTNITETINILAPEKTVKPRKRQPPWVNTSINLLYRKRDAALRRYRRTRDHSFLEEFLRLRKEACEATASERAQYISDKLAKTLDCNGNFWMEMRNLGLLPKPKATNDLHGFSLDELNNHFAQVSCSPSNNINDVPHLLNSSSNDGFKFSPVSFNDVVLAVSHFVTQARGEDDIPQSVIAKSLPTIGHFLVKIFNTSLMSNTFPEAWKKARLIPLKKKSAPSSPSDFRPIALLSFLSKVLEKLVHDQLLDFVAHKGILDPLQAGFRKHHSTATALLKLTDDIRRGFDRRLITIALLFDFSKAFDTISHTILLRKLSSMGLARATLCWIHSYLSGRQQRVLSKSDTSQWIGTDLGVPQGSVLGPLLFCLYINDVQSLFVDRGIGHVLYADDLQIYLQVPSNQFEEGTDKLAIAAKDVSEWAARSGLRLNPSKTQAIFFAPPHTASIIENKGFSGVQLGPGSTIPFSETVLSLGVVLERSLSWKPYIDLVTKKVNSAMYSLRSMRPCTTQVLRQRLVEALVFPHLDYCSTVLLDATNEQKTRLQRLQNSCIRYIYGLRRRVHITPYRARLNWMRTDTRSTYTTYVILYKVFNLRAPSYLLELFEKRQSNRPARSGAGDLKIPRVYTEFGCRSLRFQGVHLWNSLPADIKYMPSLNKFKSSLKKYLLSLD